MAETKGSKKTKKTKEKFDTDYFLDQIMTINETLSTALKDIERINENVACEEIEELRPTIDMMRGRLGL